MRSVVFLGAKLFGNPNSKIFKQQYLDKTHEFYKKYGGKTIIIARFVPIVRTFAPFVAGMGKMHYCYFITYNVVGGALWVALFCYAGYFFGDLPFCSEKFEDTDHCNHCRLYITGHNRGIASEIDKEKN